MQSASLWLHLQEKGLALADALAEAGERISAGETVGGPAAGRYRTAGAEFSYRYTGACLGKTRAVSTTLPPRCAPQTAIQHRRPQGHAPWTAAPTGRSRYAEGGFCSRPVQGATVARRGGEGAGSGGEGG